MSQEARRSRVLTAAEICHRHGITQADIALAVGASQSQVSRILSGRSLRASRLLEEVVLYVEQFEGGVTTEAVSKNPDLMEALRQAWDGSAAHARALATVIRSLKVLRGSGR